MGLYILNFEEGNEVDREEETTKLPRGVADRGMRRRGDRRVSTEQAVLCSSSLFKLTFFSCPKPLSPLAMCCRGCSVIQNQSAVTDPQDK